jgi:hypothetical protein
MLFGTSNFDRQGIINNTVALGKAAKAFDVPAALTTVETKSFSGNMAATARRIPGSAAVRKTSSCHVKPQAALTPKGERQFGKLSFFKSAANRGSLCKLFSRGSTFVDIMLGSRWA